MEYPEHWRKGIEYLGFLIGKSVPKSMSLRGAMITMLPLLFGLQSGEDKSIVIALVYKFGIPSTQFHQLLATPTDDQLRAAGDLMPMSEKRKERWRGRVMRDISAQLKVCILFFLEIRLLCCVACCVELSVLVEKVLLMMLNEDDYSFVMNVVYHHRFQPNQSLACNMQEWVISHKSQEWGISQKSLFCMPYACLLKSILSADFVG